MTRARQAAVVSTVSAAPPAPVSASAAPVAPPRPLLCAAGLERPGKPVPAVKMAREAAAGAAPVAAELPVGGQWTWVNFWAAWCAPCKEEIPVLLAWERTLNAAGISFQVAFVSLDDDPRQLMAFLTGEPASGLRATHWLEAIEPRKEWLEQVGVGADPDLPEHLLIDPKGRIRCVIEGAVEASDLPRLQQLLGGD